ncbi:MAG: hypothetical protein ACJ79R_13370, partial [Anaeromyxobacteraceae bacterium]
MNSSLRSAIASFLLVSSASAQVSAPSLVEEDLAPAEEAAPPDARQPQDEPEPMVPPRWEKEPLKGVAPARTRRAATQPPAAGPTATAIPNPSPSPNPTSNPNPNPTTEQAAGS